MPAPSSPADARRLYINLHSLVAKLKPQWAPPPSAAERIVPLPPKPEHVGASADRRVRPVLLGGLKGQRNHDVPTSYLLTQLFVALLPMLLFVVVSLWSYQSVTYVPPPEADSGLRQIGTYSGERDSPAAGGLQEPDSGRLQEPPRRRAAGAAATTRRRPERAAGCVRLRCCRAASPASVAATSATNAGAEAETGSRRRQATG